MLYSGRILAVSYPTKPSISHNYKSYNFRLNHRKLEFLSRWRCMASMASDSDSPSSFSSFSSDSDSPDVNNAGFCIIEGPETVQDFAKMELQEIQDNIRSRRNKIFLHMEEVRRLRIQQRIKSAELGILKEEQENELPNFPSFIPFLPPLSSANLKQYYATCFSLIAGFMLFGGLLAPTGRLLPPSTTISRSPSLADHHPTFTLSNRHQTWRPPPPTTYPRSSPPFDHHQAFSAGLSPEP
ncbi:hypothetical protein Cgig2_026406 [Carnegiea gigantea]|uniref:Uncharacterized protein n=1 Tax=Carnegiea gigantea TaxID=171969 RepID=A0A9Q1QB86_9CARY|nr:hypothetical protein Cgig2_026406 [Carnegiea gigantea]